MAHPNSRRTIDVLHAGAHRGDDRLLAEIRALIAPYYENVDAIIERETRHCSELYLLREDGVLASLLFSNMEEMPLNGTPTPCLYVGLNATDPRLVHSGRSFVLYDRMFADGRRWELENHRPLIHWFTTATPLGYTMATKYFEHLAPTPTGEYGGLVASIARAIRTAIGAPNDDLEHPFVLRRYAEETRYTASERSRLAGLEANLQCPLFSALRIDESAGDRLLLICSGLRS